MQDGCTDAQMLCDDLEGGMRGVLCDDLEGGMRGEAGGLGGRVCLYNYS